jgi:tetratricopeptide (TPR) repeat protein
LTALDDPPTAVNLAAEAVELSRAMGPEGRELLMWRLINLAELLIEDLGEPDRAVAPLEGSEAILQALGPDRYAPAEGLRVRASFAGVRAELANKQGRYADAKVHAAESIRLIEASSDRGPAARVHAQLGIACLRLGECQKARQRFTLALKLNRESQGWEVAYNLHWLAAVDLAEGLLDRALDYCQESITEAELIPDRNIIASALGLMAGISSKRGQPAHAAHLAGASAAMWARQKRKPWGDYSLDTLLPGWREVPEHEAIQAAFEAGQAMNSDEAVAFALRDLEV